MNREQTIADLIRCTIHRAIRESVGGLVVIFGFTFLLLRSSPGTARYYGCLVVLISTPFVLGVVWAYTLNHRLLRVHPASDTRFWREAFAAQARLLQLVPLWYLAPLSSGMLLILASAPGSFTSLALRIVLLAGLFAAITWLNRSAASKLTERAAALGA